MFTVNDLRRIWDSLTGVSAYGGSDPKLVENFLTKVNNSIGAADLPTPPVGFPAGAKIYSALLSQSGTAAPTAIVLQNTLGVTPVYSRSSSGFYRLTATGAFPFNKTLVFMSQGDAAGSVIVWVHTTSGGNQILIEGGAGFVDGSLDHAPFLVVVYP